MNKFQKNENTFCIEKTRILWKEGNDMKDFFGSEKYKKLVIAFALTVGISIITFAIIFISYSQKLKSQTNYGAITANTINRLVSNNETNTSMASTTTDKNVNEALNEVLNNIETEPKTEEKTQETMAPEPVVVPEEKKEEPVKPLSFRAPVSGDIIADYAEESLIYSATLEEWTTHLGVDIKADKTSVVVASEAGTVKSIKNDPRYGLTITISHRDDFETVYSNLLSSEFVNEGDKVEKGQTIGTVGESASFEVAEVPHLHFEMYKSGNVVNPTIYLSE